MNISTQNGNVSFPRCVTKAPGIPTHVHKGFETRTWFEIIVFLRGKQDKQSIIRNIFFKVLQNGCHNSHRSLLRSLTSVN